MKVLKIREGQGGRGYGRETAGQGETGKMKS